MLMEIGSVQKVPDFIKRVKAGETKLMGFGHRVYKNYDPRARIIKKVAYEVFDLMGKNPLLEIALECERIALEDDYFVKRKLYPNVDFYTGLIYQSMGFPIDDVPGAVRDSANVGLDCAVGRDAPRSRAENRAAAPDLSRARHAALRADRPARITLYHILRIQGRDSENGSRLFNVRASWAQRLFGFHFRVKRRPYMILLTQ